LLRINMICPMLVLMEHFIFQIINLMPSLIMLCSYLVNVLYFLVTLVDVKVISFSWAT